MLTRDRRNTSRDGRTAKLSFITPVFFNQGIVTFIYYVLSQDQYNSYPNCRVCSRLHYYSHRTVCSSLSMLSWLDDLPKLTVVISQRKIWRNKIPLLYHDEYKKNYTKHLNLVILLIISDQDYKNIFYNTPINISIKNKNIQNSTRAAVSGFLATSAKFLLTNTFTGCASQSSGISSDMRWGLNKKGWSSKKKVYNIFLIMQIKHGNF